MLRPFVYRRYLDFGVFESLREMKDLIAREVARRELQGNVKLGPGGIREIEFIVQAFQLIRGGGNPRLQTRSLLEALPQLAGQKLLTAGSRRWSWRNRTGSCGASRTGCRSGTTSRRTNCPRRSRRVRGSRLRWITTTGTSLDAGIARHRDRVSAWFRRTVFAPAQPEPRRRGERRCRAPAR